MGSVPPPSPPRLSYEQFQRRLSHLQAEHSPPTWKNIHPELWDYFERERIFLERLRTAISLIPLVLMVLAATLGLIAIVSSWGP